MFDFLKSIALGIFTVITLAIALVVGPPKNPPPSPIPPASENENQTVSAEKTDEDNSADAENIKIEEELIIEEEEIKIEEPEIEEFADIPAQDTEAIRSEKQNEESIATAMPETATTTIAVNNGPSAEDINSDVRNAVVNVFCASSANNLNSITGSGIIIDPRGVVLTNAHIGQYLLLDDFINCTIRAGSPAENRYTAELLFISPSWIAENYQKLNDENPRGTGENDFALLRITGRTNPQATLPASFSFVDLELSPDTPKIGESVIIIGYPAGFLGGAIIQSGLNILSSIGSVNDIFTFNNNTLDLFSVLGSVLAQKGSSGGAVVNTGGNLIGIVVTATSEETTGERELRAITASHINKSFFNDFSVSLPAFLIGELGPKAAQFQSIVAPSLRALLLNNF